MPASSLSAPTRPAFQRVSLRRWLWQHTRLPLLFLILLFLAVEAIILVLVARNQFQHQMVIASRLAEMSHIAISEKSSLLLQAGFDLAKRELGALDAFVCESKRIYILKNPDSLHCPLPARWGYRVLETPLQAGLASNNQKAQYSFILQAPIFPQENRILMSLGLSLLLCFLGVGLIIRLRRKLESELFHPMLKGLLGEKPFFITELENLRSRLIELTRLRTQHAVNVAILERNAQVAHDIQSPLTVLLFSLKNLQGLSEEVRDAIRSSVKRISAITDDLILKADPVKEKFLEAKHGPPLNKLLREILEEKKLEYFHLPDVQWKLKLPDPVSESFSDVFCEDLQRVLSNLLNNAVEAREKDTGVIELGAKESESGQLVIWVRDEGRGFPVDFHLDQIGKGYTRGKSRGQGLGLKSARDFVDIHHGKLEVLSDRKQGTRVLLKFCYNK